MSDRDPQRTRVYDMERKAFYAWALHATTVPRLRRMANAVCSHYDLEPVTFAFLSPRSIYRGMYDVDNDEIELCPNQGRTALLLAHELAHHVISKLHPRAQDHGPLWAKHYAEILQFLGVMPADSFRVAARKHGVTVAR